MLEAFISFHLNVEFKSYRFLRGIAGVIVYFQDLIIGASEVLGEPGVRDPAAL